MEHWGQIFPFLKQHMWTCKIDLKDAYFHLGLDPCLQSLINLKIGQNIYKFLAAPFGLNILPYLWTQVMKVLQKLWRKRGILCFIYLDDILIVNLSKKALKTQLQYVLDTLDKAGLGVNLKKSTLEPTQLI